MSASISGRQQGQEVVVEDNINDLEPTVALNKLFLRSLDNVAQAKAHFPPQVASCLDGIPIKLKDAYFRLQIWWHDMNAESDQKLTFEKILSFEHCLPSERVREILQKFQDEFGMIQDLLANLASVSEIDDELLAPLRDACNRVMDLVLDLVDLSDVIGTEQALRLHDGPKRAFIEHIIATESAFRQSHLKKAKGIQSKVSDDPIAEDTSSVLHEHQSALSASHEVKPWAPKYMLTIDGGGVGGLSSLIVLETLMDMLKDLEAANDPSDIPNPLNVCHYFDYVVGIDTGGMIAMMLSRLRMSIKECIVAYKRWGWESRKRELASFLASTDDGPFLQEEPAMCRTMLYVCRAGETAMSPTFLNSFQDGEQQSVDVELRQAARATSAAPTYSKPLSINGEEYTGGSLRNNHLETLAFEKVRRLSQREEEGRGHVAMLLSLGSESNGRRGKFKRWLGSIPRLVKDSRRSSDLTVEGHDLSKYAEMVDNRLHYERLNVRLGRFGLFQNESIDDIEAEVRMFLKKSDVRFRMLQCAETLFTARKNRAQTDRWKLYYGISKEHEPRALNVSDEGQSARAQERKRQITRSQNQNPPPVIRDPDPTVPLFPRTIPAQVYYHVDERGISAESSFHTFDWTVPEAYKDLDPIKNRSEAWAGGEFAPTTLYTRTVSCRVKGPPELPNDEHYAILDNMHFDFKALSENAIVQICDFIHQHPKARFSLEVYWDCGYVKLKKSERQSYAGMVKSELKRKVKVNFLGLEYIPCCDVDALLSLEVVERIAEEDTKLQLDQAACKALITKVLNKASKLFAICVYLRLDMEYLRHLINDHGCSDEPSEHPNDNTHVGCHKEDCDTDTHDVIGCLPKFFARKVIRNLKHHNLSDDDVLPLCHTGDKDRTGRPRLSWLGGGASGKVYKVTIERSHQYVSGDPDCEFAVKEFSRHESFEREKAMLLKFAGISHDHIVGHIMSWTQHHKSYVLYDKARCDLRHFIQNTQSPSLTTPVVLWFLHQLKGLATAVKHVHSLEENDPEHRHNNIKPEKILVFEKHEGQYRSFKFSNLGQGVLNNATGSKVHWGDEWDGWDEVDLGTRAYWPPEAYKMRGTRVASRPIDMWGLGCIFLELLLWLSGFYLYGEEAWFPEGPSNFPGYGSIDVFWSEEPGGFDKGSSNLKPVVERALQELDRIFAGMQAFQNTIVAIRQLLRIDPKLRWKATELADWMDQILRQVEADSKETNIPDYYQRQYRKNRAESDLGKTPLSVWLNC
ncbi:hypothetical protein LTS17_001338 [Exophiala oligosperma]